MVATVGGFMTAITATEARKRLFPLIEQVNDDHTPVEIVHKRGNAVLVSKEDWDSMVETAYLSQGPNGRKLRRAIEELNAGGGVEHELIDAE
ncbi:MAG TPA: type II toxin-antitoxin system prevent-host-death family antitoxin [Micromonosporaceae bacterium]|nr:type II toxin-antitoxin system prevent-host-death family antitoxin [Micromonosporaceae bacterium]